MVWQGAVISRLGKGNMEQKGREGGFQEGSVRVEVCCYGMGFLGGGDV
jgi:hypothetical protein